MYPKNVRAEPPCPSVFNIEGCTSSSHETTATAKETQLNIECVGLKGRRRRQFHCASVSMALTALRIQRTIAARQHQSKWCKVFSTTGLPLVASRVPPKGNRCCQRNSQIARNCRAMQKTYSRHTVDIQKTYNRHTVDIWKTPKGFTNSCLRKKN